MITVTSCNQQLDYGGDSSMDFLPCQSLTYLPGIRQMFRVELDFPHLPNHSRHLKECT